MPGSPTSALPALPPATGAQADPYRFDPRRHRRTLAALLAELASVAEETPAVRDRILARHPRDGRGFFSKSELLAGLRWLGEHEPEALAGVDVDRLERRLRGKPVRSLSGVAVVTVFTRPHPCPGRCVFCPSDVRMPKSYLADEPGCQRAAANRFDPYAQVWSRLRALVHNGHPVDKVELIVLGGTWSSYPESYQVEFVARCFEALNDAGAALRGDAGGAPGVEVAPGSDGRLLPRRVPAPVGGPPPGASGSGPGLDGRRLTAGRTPEGWSYNRLVTARDAGARGGPDHPPAPLLLTTPHFETAAARPPQRLSVDGKAVGPSEGLPVDGKAGRPSEGLSVDGKAGRPPRRLSVDGDEGGTAPDWDRLQRAHRANETAGCRCVGLSLETRPDRVDGAEVHRLRRLGATKVQLGLQSLSDAVLAANRRDHDVARSREAVRLLRGAGFKVQAHWMANLLGSDPAADVADHRRLFADAAFRPDELKIYPCSLVESAELMRCWEAGEWRPYDAGELLAVVTEAVAATPRWCRLSRVVRDIPGTEVVAGSRVTNLRQVAEAELARRGRPVRDVRAREVRGRPVDPATLELRRTAYATSVGEERFLEWVTPDDRLAAFLRLSLPDGGALDGAAPEVAAELAGRAVIREVHVYGRAVGFGVDDGPVQGPVQHRGLGTRLVEEAAGIAAAAGYGWLAVISAVGTRGWYRGLGFGDGGLYQHRRLMV